MRFNCQGRVSTGRPCLHAVNIDTEVGHNAVENDMMGSNGCHLERIRCVWKTRVLEIMVRRSSDDDDNVMHERL